MNPNKIPTEVGKATKQEVDRRLRHYDEMVSAGDENMVSEVIEEISSWADNEEAYKTDPIRLERYPDWSWDDIKRLSQEIQGHFNPESSKRDVEALSMTTSRIKKQEQEEEKRQARILAEKRAEEQRLENNRQETITQIQEEEAILTTMIKNLGDSQAEVKKANILSRIMAPVLNYASFLFDVEDTYGERVRRRDYIQDLVDKKREEIAALKEKLGK